MEHITYTAGTGEWICTLEDLRSWFRCQFQHQAVSILDALQRQNYITYSLLENKKIVKFKITDWPKDNTVLEYNYPCKKDDGFFFFTIAKVHEFISDYLSIMFDISDVMIDKEEVAMTMQMSIHVPENKGEPCVSEWITEDQISVPEKDSCVPEPHMKFIIQKVAELLKTQGIP